MVTAVCVLRHNKRNGGKISGKFLVLCFQFLNNKSLEKHFLKELLFLKEPKKD